MRRHAMQNQQPNEKKQPQMPVGGFVIDAQGREIPITEAMIQQACTSLERAQQQAAKNK
ncbi:PA1571 family protein [Pseudomonas leptonychotis]|uniref:PA1571 family protein n=2 Tax=Pseudomonas leptonychotis TaxID=2448482 RepID=UPI0038669BD7